MPKIKKERLKAYMDQKVRPLFDQLFTELLVALPDDVAQWSGQWLLNYGKPPQQQKGSVEEQHQGSVEEQHQGSVEEQHQGSIEEGDNDVAPVVPVQEKTKPKEQLVQSQVVHTEPSEDDEVDHIQPANKDGKNRAGVSAEAYGEFNKKGEYKARVIKKTEDQNKRIKDRLVNAFMFQGLDDKELKIVIDAMDEKHFKAAEFVIKQGEEGNELFVIDKGELDCFRVMKAGEEPKKLKTYKPGESFGELALLYNAPRAATIKTVSDSVCYALDRETFNHIVKDAAMKYSTLTTQENENISKLLTDMDEYERSKLCDGLQELKVKAGDVVIKQNDPGDRFFMISEGILKASIVEKQGAAPKEVYDLKSGDYFGELALINNAPRKATVTANTDCQLLFVDTEAFKRLMGPLEEILKRNAARYEKHVQK